MLNFIDYFNDYLGQLYVAMSRVTSPEGLIIYKPKDDKGKKQTHMKNVVYHEILTKRKSPSPPAQPQISPNPHMNEETLNALMEGEEHLIPRTQHDLDIGNTYLLKTL